MQRANDPVHPPIVTFRIQEGTLRGQCATGLLGRVATYSVFLQLPHAVVPPNLA